MNNHCEERNKGRKGGRNRGKKGEERGGREEFMLFGGPVLATICKLISFPSPL